MIKVNVIQNIEKIEEILPQCLEAVEQCNRALPFHFLTFPLLWYKYFNSSNGEDFGSKRGVNFFGDRSWLEQLFLVVVTEKHKIVGFTTLVFFRSKLSGRKTELNLLSFAGDHVLIPYTDFFSFDENKYMILKSIMIPIMQMASKKFDLIFLGHIPGGSIHLPDLEMI